MEYFNYPLEFALRWWEPLIGMVGCYYAGGAANAYSYCVLPFGDRYPRYGSV